MKYSKFDKNDYQAISKIIDESRILYGKNINNDYSHDELGGISNMPDVVIFPISTKEVSEIIKYANSKLIPIVARGTGSGLVGAAVPIYGGIVLDLTKMNKIIELDKENFTVTVQPGVLLMELASYVDQNGYLYAPDPGEKTATIGGNISTNAGGMRAVKYGCTRESVVGLTVVLANGEILELGGKVVKNSSGYDLLDLIIGSEGTLAIITQATMKLYPKPKYSVSLLLLFNSIESGISAVPHIIKSQVNITAIEFMQKDLILFTEKYLGKKFPDSSSEAYLLLTFDGNNIDEIESEYSNVADLCIQNGAIDAYIIDTDERKDVVWTARSAFLEAIKASTDKIDECDVVVPRSKIAQFIDYTHKVEKQANIRIPSFGHAGDGNLHIYVCKDNLDNDQWNKKHDEVFELFYKKAASMGGYPSGEHGIGYIKRKYLKQKLSPTHIKLMRDIKKVFDPNMILNPNKVIPLEN